MSIDDRLHSLTTIVDVDAQGSGSSRGTGFFYHVLASSGDEKGPGWRQQVSYWLITNRHVLIPDDNIPNTLSFRLRQQSDGGALDWYGIEVPVPALLERAKLHADPNVDVVAIDVTEELHTAVRNGVPITYSAVGELDFAGVNKIDATVASDVIVVGYPKGYYDEVNNFPIVKAGIVASRWGLKFKGMDAFIIDAKLFPGSSGSIVLTKPSDMVVQSGQMFAAKEKQFAFLGVYSGEPYELSKVPIETDDGILFPKEYFGIGLVWYAALIPEIISNGKTLDAVISMSASRPAVVN